MRVQKITPNATFQPFPSNGGSFRTQILGKHPKRESYVHPIEEKCPGVPMIPSRANFLVSTPIWEISSSICIYYTYVSVFWPFWPTGHPRVCPGIPGRGVPIGANFLVSSPIWEISSSICISHTYFSVFWPFWPTGHPRVTARSFLGPMIGNKFWLWKLLNFPQNSGGKLSDFQWFS